MEKRRHPRGDRGFARLLLTWSGILGAICLIILVLLWQFLSSYEKSLPEHPLDRLIASPELLKEAAATDNKALDDYIWDGKLEGRTLTYTKKAGEYTAAKPVYSLLADGHPCYTVSLAEGEEVGFGMRLWEVDSITPEAAFFDIPLYTLRVTAPEGAAVKVNGALLDRTNITESSVTYDSINPYEIEEGGLLCSTWTVDGLFEIPTVEATLAETSLTPSKSDDFTYVFLPGTPRTLTLSAPSNATVTVNGFILSENYITASTPYGDITPLEADASGIPTALEYKLPGILGEPVIEAHMGDMLLLPNQNGDSYSFPYPESLKYSVKITLPCGIVPEAGGRSLEGGKVSEGGKYEALVGLEDILGESMPTFSVYEASGLYLKPTVTAKDELGELTAITANENGHRLEYEFARVNDGEHDTDNLISLMKRYIEYTAYGHQDTRANHDKMLPYMVSGSPVANRMRNSIESIKWNSILPDIEYHSYGTSNFIDYNENCYSCTLSCDVTLSRWSTKRHYDSKWDVVCIRTTSGWLVWEMKAK